jgi:hypothetical protein
MQCSKIVAAAHDRDICDAVKTRSGNLRHSNAHANVNVTHEQASMLHRVLNQVVDDGKFGRTACGDGDFAVHHACLGAKRNSFLGIL